MGINWWNGQNELSNSSSQINRRSDRTQPRHCFPTVVPNIGPQWGRRATWVGASGDQTYVKIDEINSISLTRSTVMANKNCISMFFFFFLNHSFTIIYYQAHLIIKIKLVSVLIPHQTDHANSFKCLVISKRDGTCNSYSGTDQVDFNNCATCLDPLYNVIWTFNPINSEISLYNIISTEVRTIPGLEVSILSPGLTLPVVSNCFVTRSQAAMHLLGCLDTLTQAQDENFSIVEENECNQSTHGKVYSREDFVTVNRFESAYKKNQKK